MTGQEIPPEAIEAAAEAMEDEAMRLLGRDLGTIHRNDIAAAALSAATPVIEEHLREKIAREVQAAKPPHMTRDYTPSAKQYERGHADGYQAGQVAALTEAAEWLATIYAVNPMNHDGSNYTIDRTVKHLDALAGNDTPSRAFEDAWDERMDKYEADYCGGDGKKRRERRARARAAEIGGDDE